MNDVSLDALRGEPARQPEGVVSGLERDGHPCDPVTLLLVWALDRTDDLRSLTGKLALRA
jgi:hypothetical protein